MNCPFVIIGGHSSGSLDISVEIKIINNTVK
jgi:hypothetical protein